MALTVDNKKRHATKSQFYVIVDVDFDSSYPTGGESLTPDSVGLGKIDFCLASPTAGYVFEYDYTNEKLKAFYADYDAVADGALIEVANEGDLSGVTNVKVIIFGK